MKLFIKTSLIAASAALIFTGCAPVQGPGAEGQTMTNAQKGALLGAAIGALAGGVTKGHHKGKRAAIGAAAGAAIGGLVGYSMDKQAKEVAHSLHTNVSDSPDAELDRSKDIIITKNDKYVKITFRDKMMFPTDSAQLTPSARQKINSLIPVLKQYPQTIIQIVGHTDSRWTWEYNKNLSDKRASVVGNILYNSALPNQIFAKGCSFNKPLVPNNSPANMALNRRVEIYLYPNQESVTDPCR